MNEQTRNDTPPKRKMGRPKKPEGPRVMVSVPAELADVIKEFIRVFRAKEGRKP